MERKELFHIVSQFHSAILSNNDFKFDGGFPPLGEYYDNFPVNKCDSASELLRRFLFEKYELVFYFVKVDYGLWEHVFLENSDYLIDITSYQFNNPKCEDFKNVENFDEIIVLSWIDKMNYYFSQYEYQPYKETFLDHETHPDFIEFYFKLISSLQWR